MDMSEEGSSVDPWPLKPHSRPSQNGTLPSQARVQTANNTTAPPHPRDQASSPPILGWTSMLSAASRRIWQPLKSGFVNVIAPRFAFRRHPDTNTGTDTDTGTDTGTDAGTKATSTEKGDGPQHAERGDRNVTQKMAPVLAVSANSVQPPEATKTNNSPRRTSRGDISRNEDGLYLWGGEDQTPFLSATTTTRRRRSDCSRSGQTLWNSTRVKLESELSNGHPMVHHQHVRVDSQEEKRLPADREPRAAHTGQSELSALGPSCQCDSDAESCGRRVHLAKAASTTACDEEKPRSSSSAKAPHFVRGALSSRRSLPFLTDLAALEPPPPPSPLPPLPHSSLSHDCQWDLSRLQRRPGMKKKKEEEEEEETAAANAFPVEMRVYTPGMTTEETESYPVLSSFSTGAQAKSGATTRTQQASSLQVTDITTRTQQASSLQVTDNTTKKLNTRTTSAQPVPAVKLCGQSANVTPPPPPPPPHLTANPPGQESGVVVAAKSPSLEAANAQETQLFASQTRSALSYKVDDRETMHLIQSLTREAERTDPSPSPGVMTQRRSQTTDRDRSSGESGTLPAHKETTRQSRGQSGTGDSVWSRLERTAGQNIRQTDLKLSAHPSAVVPSGREGDQPPGDCSLTPPAAADHCPASTGHEVPGHDPDTSLTACRVIAAAAPTHRPSHTRRYGASVRNPGHSRDPSAADLDLDRASRWFSVPSFPPNHHLDPSATLLQFDPRTCREYHFLRDF